MYTVLSHKYGTTLIFLGIVLIVVSAFQFGETVMEWSYAQYVNMFSSFTDNVAGISFKNRLCSPIPIDAVYTWVNGSDPNLLSQIRHIEMDLKRQINGIRDDNCTFSHCVPTNLIVIEPEFSTELRLDELKQKYKMFEMASKMYSLNFTGEHHKFTVITYPDEKAVLKALEYRKEIKEKDMIIKRGYYTSDWTLQQSVLLSDTVLMTGLTKNVKVKSIKNLLYKYQIAFSKVTLYKIQQLAVIHLSSKEAIEELLQVNVTFDNQNATLVVANLVWDLTDYSQNEDTSPSRFEDNEELRYSLRSIDRFAPWIRHVFIVTNGQIPLWLNLDSPRLTLVTHEEIFPNRSHLPTFSSPAIEANLHRIPGISDKFIYLNDDVMFGKEVWPDDFYSHSTGQKVYLTWPIPSCDENCPNTWIKDGYCDKHCNNSQCEWDGGDCEGKTDSEPLHSRNIWAGDISFQSDVKLIYCSNGCANSWLGDRYCDDPCNVYECGFDAGDCGIQHYNELHHINFVPGQAVYKVDPGQNIFYFNLTFLVGDDGRVETAYMHSNKIIRTVIISQKFKVMTLLLYPNHTEVLNFSLLCHEKNSNHTKQLNFTVMVDTKAMKSVHSSRTKLDPLKKSDPTTPTILLQEEEPMIAIQNISTQQLYPKPKNSSSIFFETNFSNYNLPHDIKETLNILNKSYEEGDLTEKGFKIKKYRLWKKFIQTNYTIKIPNSSLEKKLNGSLNSNPKITATLNHPSQNPNFAEKEFQPYRPERRHLLSFPDDFLQPGVFPWEKSNGLIFKLQKELEKRQKYERVSQFQRKLLDTFGDSIRHVNRLYNKAFGYTSRKVLAHIPHMIDKNVMKELHDLFPQEWEVTSSHRIRSSDDMQFAFAYFYYLMGVTVEVNPAEIFDETDTDMSGVLSDREFRTLATRLYTLPLDLVTLSTLEAKIINCSEIYPELEKEVPEHIKEKYYETKMPQLTKDFFLQCPAITDVIKENFKPQPKYKYIIHEDHETTFQMIKTNISAAVSQLDRIRKHPKKFICLNDNIDHGKEESQTVKAILKDFFESMYPIPSRFELPKQYRNRFLHINELREWRIYRSWLRFWTYLTLTVLILLALMSFCSDNIESVHRRIFSHRSRVKSSNQPNIKEKERKMTKTEDFPYLV
ncbi:GNPTAB [Acanthosepion pharaonis]|uniref:GNPTAB n=1 Tax=Acanthosepion pharaonis TaxID=158019 RepID=A0A812CFE6_ACAPH|nr:GNPTAB [Sepia pharaonis]